MLLAICFVYTGYWTWSLIVFLMHHLMFYYYYYYIFLLLEKKKKKLLQLLYYMPWIGYGLCRGIAMVSQLLTYDNWWYWNHEHLFFVSFSIWICLDSPLRNLKVTLETLNLFWFVWELLIRINLAKPSFEYLKVYLSL